MFEPEAIDRVAPTRRPPQRVVMYQSWRSLLFLHWVIPAERIRPLLPAGLELDLFEGNAYVGLVPFTMRGVRPVRLPGVPWLSNFHETNVRTYVHHRGRNPGVYFFSLEAANPIAVVLARSLFHLDYHYARMSLVHGESGTISYRSERSWPGPLPASCRVTWTPSGELASARLGTLDHFLIERYLLYTSWHGRLYSGQVHHPAYPLQIAHVEVLEETLIRAAGLERPDRPPLVHYSAGVDVEIFSLKSVDLS